MIKFFPRDSLGELHTIPRKNKNAVYRLQISVLVREIFKFERCVKYANEMTDDVIHSTQFYIKCIISDILVNLQGRPLKLGRPIGLQETLADIKNFVPMATQSFPVPTHVSDFQLAKY